MNAADDHSDGPPAGARRVVVGFDRLPRWLDGFAQRHGDVTTAVTPAAVSLTGADGAQAWITVPFPPMTGAPMTRAPTTGAPTTGAPTTGPPLRGAPLHGALIDHLAVERTVGVLLVRRGGYAAGVFTGRRLVASKVGTGYVQGGTKAGGWSQQRFARRRGNQAAALFGEAADVAARILAGSDSPTLDALLCGGDRTAVDTVLADARLAAVAVRRTDPWLAGPDPRLKVLEQTPDRFLAVEITLHP